ncbi:transglutaminase-like domain-containing protein [Candidatus Woesearchaeota archaeon]|nr:transglutaminase-like domain-containing protein [Candidatus Woesearchaeota archaeon]
MKTRKNEKAFFVSQKPKVSGKLVWLLVFILVLGMVNAQNYYNKDSLDLNLRMDSTINIVPTSTSYSIEKIESKLYFYPQDDFQQTVLEIQTSPEVTEEEDYLLYKWLGPKEKTLDYSLEAKVRVFDNIHKVKEKIGFPLKNLPEEFLIYTEPAEIIDSDNLKIKQQASLLAEGEDDLYVVVHKLASWVRENIDYDLSTATVKASQKASWVLENKRGVCDEMTSLFMAMARSLGIPARFISGVSYSNDPIFENPWQAHGWAEVYFPGYGWVPFDVTFDESGYIDPTHIKLHESLDAGQATTKFEWLGRNVELEVDELDIDVGILSMGEEKIRDVDLTIEVLEENIGFGSYNLVKVEIENLKNYYVAKTLYLVSTPEVEVEDAKRHLLLKPEEKITLYWILKLTENLQRSYTYTFPVEVNTEKDYSMQTEFYSKRGEIVFSEEEIKERLEGLVGEEEKTLSKDLAVNCDLKEEAISLGAETGISCKVKNLGNTILRGLEVCLGSACEKTDLNINEEKSFGGVVKGEEVGEQQFLVKVSNQEISKNVYVDYSVFDESAVKIAEVQYPEKANYGEEFVISFVLEKKSFSNPKNVKVTLLHEGYPNEWMIEELSEDKKFAVDFSGSDLGFGENDFEIVVEWDRAKTREEFMIELGETSFGEKFAVILRSINRFFGRLFK